MVSVGGNGASSKKDIELGQVWYLIVSFPDLCNLTYIELFEKKYDQLISLVKTGNPDCELYMCNISPRGDADVRHYNACIAQLVTYWKKHKVTLIKESESFFYGRDGLPTSRYFGDDGIHLSNSGIKRLLHTIDSEVHIVSDFELCTYKSRGSVNGMVYAPQRTYTQQTTSSTRRTLGPEANKMIKNDYTDWNHGQRENRLYNGRTKCKCLACGMAGHVVKDC